MPPGRVKCDTMGCVKTCEGRDCDRPAYAHGLCMTHYMRQRRHGDPEIVQKRGPKTDHEQHGTPEYRSWSMMKQRCLNPNAQGYERYGALGITVWPTWIASFRAFYDYLGPRPDGTSLDRYPDVNGNYEPGNVRWATRSQQNASASRRRLARADNGYSVKLESDSE